MARYSKASDIETECWNLKNADQLRGQNRALIDSLFNGNPPFTEAEAKDAKIKTNVNFLEASKIAHDARRQYSNAHLKPGNFFDVKCDYGPKHKRELISSTITRAINKQMKGSLHYRETLRNVFAQVVIHGIGPVAWDGKQKWIPSMQAISDVLIPSRTLLTMENLNKFAVFRRYTAEQLYRLTHGPKVDKAWKMPVVNKAITWAKKQADTVYGISNNSDMYLNPERIEEDFKENGGSYSSDQVPTIDCWDFYFLDETDKELGWKRRIILDQKEIGDGKITSSTKNIIDGRGEFLYDSGQRNYADKLSQIMHFQFADGSCVAPFRYHSVRSLGFLLYSVCHLQNRLRCKFNDSVFEAMLQFFRVQNPDDQEIMTKMALLDKGIMAEGVSFVTQNDRWNVPLPLVQTLIGMNRQSMEDNSSSFTQDYDFAKDGREKTATEITAKVTASSALVSAMLQESYSYQEFQYIEVARRFCIKDSRDPDVREFRLACLKNDVPEEALNSDRWDIAAERVIGAGNKQMELAQVDLLMRDYNRYSPDAQRIILRRKTLAATDDPALTTQLVPFEENKVSSARHDAQLAAGSLMQGLPVDLKQDMNHIDYVEALIMDMAIIVKGIEESGGMATKQQVIGLQNMAQHIGMHIQIISQDKNEMQRVRQYGDDLGNLMNNVKAYAQRLAEQEQAQGGDPELQGKIKAQIITAQSKAQIAQQSSAQKLQQKQISFDQKTGQSQAKHELEMANRIRETQVDEAATDIKTSAEIVRGNAKAKNGKPEPEQV